MATPDPASGLRELLAQRSAALAEQALQGGATKAEVERLQMLAQLADLASVKRPVRRPWAPAIALVATLTLASLLLYARVGETEIELEAIVDEASFTVQATQPVTETIVAKRFAAAGLRELRWPSGVASGGTEATGALRIEAAASTPESGTVTLPSLVLPAGSTLTLRMRPALRLVLQLAPALTINLVGALQVQTAAARPQMLKLNVPAALALTPAGAELELDFEPSTVGDAPASLFALPIQVSRLVFERIDMAQQGQQTVVRRLSTIISGELRMVALDAPARKLRRGELLRLDVANGTLRTLQREGGALALSFNGRVRGLVSGSDDNPRSLMPTWLEWLRNRHGLSLLWGSGLYLSGLALAVWRWWSRTS